MRLFVRKVNQAEELLFFASASNLACSCLAWAFFSMACAEHCYLTALEFPHFKPAFFFLVVFFFGGGSKPPEKQNSSITIVISVVFKKDGDDDEKKKKKNFLGKIVIFDRIIGETESFDFGFR